MTKQVRLIRTMTYEYTPDPEEYPEGYTLEQMARLDAEHEDPTLIQMKLLMRSLMVKQMNLPSRFLRHSMI
ncbi:hypothetical protein [Bacillus licheniformis]|uniref:hypothetical protein n=1 Tax=Bacillus licheniformis TaxID=1402 RepID=UPI000929BA5C|nr:hypothetical protein [Bacillus licheniformis]OJT66892.1 hypothetical protein BFP46_22810 [Bacillus licheniformis]